MLDGRFDPAFHQVFLARGHAVTTEPTPAPSGAKGHSKADTQSDPVRIGQPATCTSRERPDKMRAPLAVTTATSSSRIPKRPGR